MKHLLLIAVLVAPVAHAQFKCTDRSGSVTMQQAPCPMSSASAAMPRGLGLYAAAPSSDRMQRGRGWLKLKIGMAENEAYKLMGTPDRINTTTTAAGKREQVIYRVAGNALYLYFEGGALTEMQTVQQP